MKKKLNLIFAGTSNFAVPILDGLLHSRHHVKAIFTQPDRPQGRGRKIGFTPVKELALSYELPIYQPNAFKQHEYETILQKYNIDLMIVASYGLIIPSYLLNTPVGGCFNVHASLLPRWRGASPIQYAILHGDYESGITIMKMDVGLDTGDILKQCSYVLKSDETYGSLENVLSSSGAVLLQEVLDDYCNDKCIPQKQDDSKATHAPKITKEQTKIMWNNGALCINRLVRSLNPQIGAYTFLNGERIKIWQTSIVTAHNNGIQYEPGGIIKVANDGIDVATGQGILRLLECQLEGKKRQFISELVKGHQKLFIGGDKFI